MTKYYNPGVFNQINICLTVWRLEVQDQSIGGLFLLKVVRGESVDGHLHVQLIFSLYTFVSKFLLF